MQADQTSVWPTSTEVTDPLISYLLHCRQNCRTYTHTHTQVRPNTPWTWPLACHQQEPQIASYSQHLTATSAAAYRCAPTSHRQSSATTTTATATTTTQQVGGSACLSMGRSAVLCTAHKRKMRPPQTCTVNPTESNNHPIPSTHSKTNKPCHGGEAREAQPTVLDISETLP